MSYIKPLPKRKDTGFPDGSVVKNLLISDWEDSLENGNPPVFLPGKFDGPRGAWWGTAHGVAKNRT